MFLVSNNKGAFAENKAHDLLMNQTNVMWGRYKKGRNFCPALFNLVFGKLITG